MSQIKIITDVDINLLKPYPHNIFNHEHNISEIINSIRDFGYNKVSIGMDEENVLLYGHGTLEALKLLDWKIVPMVAKITGLDDEQKKCYRIADNTTASGSKIITQLLREEINNQLTFDFADYGMPIADLLSIDNRDTTQELNNSAEQFKQQNPDFIRPEKLWMYIEFKSPDDWELVITKLGLGKSRRVLDTDKFMEMFINAQISKS